MDYFGAGSGNGPAMFNMGAQIGAVNSKAAGPGMALKNVLERARSWSDRQHQSDLLKNTELDKIRFKHQLDLEGGGGGVVDMMGDTQAPEGFSLVPQYTVDSAGNRIIKHPKYLRQDPNVGLTRQITEQMQAAAAEKKAKAAKGFWPFGGAPQAPGAGTTDLESKMQSLLTNIQALKELESEDME